MDTFHYKRYTENVLKINSFCCDFRNFLEAYFIKEKPEFYEFPTYIGEEVALLNNIIITLLIWVKLIEWDEKSSFILEH
jgi:hypothetical protein